ncbi:diaminohydroxyphosphoribosylaminopyrimidine deaminase [Krasilnikovia cinnamomea]|uniref:Diaminohydroxyphosphoribosylaminopyrimidine deaminase n=1 Tax=Krasilnikovia cinnamomea TaxID=349313 RepID=A0A4Q7ZS16_9ACTN|nr:deaminase [Krasilnikovia cinnamomea]RZU53958.1 diaminohydroxyphosphoribosylaminopyrimidine deaminase [Krasilnikovia cinnamomea]
MSGERDRGWLMAAIDLSRLSPRSQDRYAVGAIVVDDRTGTALAAGYTAETGPHLHAEEVALAKLPRRYDGDLGGATMYTSLEPCTTRRSRPDSCAGLILAAGLGRVVLALREPPVFAACQGIRTLRRAGVDVVELGDLGHLVREINAHVLGGIGEPAVV